MLVEECPGPFSWFTSMSKFIGFMKYKVDISTLRRYAYRAVYSPSSQSDKNF